MAREPGPSRAVGREASTGLGGWPGSQVLAERSAGKKGALFCHRDVRWDGDPRKGGLKVKGALHAGGSAVLGRLARPVWRYCGGGRLSSFEGAAGFRGPAMLCASPCGGHRQGLCGRWSLHGPPRGLPGLFQTGPWGSPVVVLKVFSVPPDWASGLQWCAQTGRRMQTGHRAGPWGLQWWSTVRTVRTGGPHAGGGVLVAGWSSGSGPLGRTPDWAPGWTMGSAAVVFSGYGTGWPYAGEWGLVTGGSLELCSPEGFGGPVAEGVSVREGSAVPGLLALPAWRYGGGVRLSFLEGGGWLWSCLRCCVRYRVGGAGCLGGWSCPCGPPVMSRGMAEAT